MLDKDWVAKHLPADKELTDQLSENYQYLISKYGEWQLFGDYGVGIRYVNVSKAIFSGFTITFTTMSLTFLLASIILGKIMFPILAKMYKDQNEELVDISTLRTAEQVNALSKDETPKERKKNKKEWF